MSITRWNYASLLITHWNDDVSSRPLQIGMMQPFCVCARSVLACCGANLFCFCFEFFLAFWRGDSEQVLLRFGAGCFRFGVVVFFRSSEEIFVRQNGEDLLHWSWLCRGSDDGNDRLEVS